MSTDLHITTWHLVPALYALLGLFIALAWRWWGKPTPPVLPECGQPVGAYTCEASPVPACASRACARCCQKYCGPDCPRAMARLGQMCTRCATAAVADPTMVQAAQVASDLGGGRE